MLYMEYCRDKLYEQSEDVIVDLLLEFILYNGYIIERHHSKLKNMKEFKDNISFNKDDFFVKLKQTINDSEDYLNKIEFANIDFQDIIHKLSKISINEDEVNKKNNTTRYIFIYLYTLVIFFIDC